MDLAADDLHEVDGNESARTPATLMCLAGEREVACWCCWRDADVRHARMCKSWWCTVLYVDAAASTLLSLSVGSKGMLCTSISTQPRPWRCSRTSCCFHLDWFLSLRCSQSIPVLTFAPTSDARGVQYLSWPCRSLPESAFTPLTPNWKG
jgi:hypothetical protein